MSDYMILHSDEFAENPFEQLEQRVRNAIERGWRPLGGVAADSLRTFLTENNVVLIQAMVMEADDE